MVYEKIRGIEITLTRDATISEVEGLMEKLTEVCDDANIVGHLRLVTKTEFENGGVQ